MRVDGEWECGCVYEWGVIDVWDVEIDVVEREGVVRVVAFVLYVRVRRRRGVKEDGGCYCWCVWWLW